MPALPIVHFGLRRFWKKLIFLVRSLLTMILKSEIRIFTLTLLAMNVDPSFLFERLHCEGGIVFFLLGLLILMPVYLVLRVGASRAQETTTASSTNSG
jgi:hypothetical protein